jgi:hypothetical protein
MEIVLGGLFLVLEYDQHRGRESAERGALSYLYVWQDYWGCAYSGIREAEHSFF